MFDLFFWDGWILQLQLVYYLKMVRNGKYVGEKEARDQRKKKQTANSGLTS